MKKRLVITFFIFTSVLTSLAQDNGKSELVKKRADHLSDQMIRELRLNNYQANRLRAINLDKVNKMMQMEQKYANDPTLLEKKSKVIAQERDKELESFLSNDQYSRYYSSRYEFYKSDKEFAAKSGIIKPGNSYQKVTPGVNNTAGDPVIKPSVNR